MDPSGSCCHPLVAEGAPSLDLLLALATGFTISLGHCLGMCGPIQAAFALEQKRSGHEGRRFAFPLLRYHLGRVLSYALIGAAFGLAGSAAGLSARAPLIQAWLSLGLGGLMVVLGAGLSGLAPLPNWGLPPGWGQPVYRWTARLLSARSGPRQFALGMANGFLPCGPVLAVALAAGASAHPAVGALLMLVYGVGTAPALVVFAFFSGRIGPGVRQRFYRVGAIFVALIGVQLGLRGLAALGMIAHLRWGELVIW